MTPDVSILVPYIESVAQHRVSKHRTDVRDIARILMDHGVFTGMAQNAVEYAIRDTMPDSPRIAQLREQARMMERAYDQRREILGLNIQSNTRQSNRDAASECHEYETQRWDAVRDEIGQFDDAAGRAVRAWWDEALPGIEAICDDVARRLLVERQVAA